MEKSGEPLHDGEVTARINAPRQVGGRPVPLGVRGRFTARLRARTGKHQVILSCRQTNASLETTFYVQGVATERVGRPARPEVLQEISRVTRGQLIGPDKLDDVVRSLAELPEPPPLVRRVQLWSHPLAAAVLVLLMGIFWAGRKVVGLI